MQARAPGHRVPRAHAPSRPRSGRRSLGEPSAPFAAPRSRPRGSLRRGRRGKRLLAPRGDKNPNLRSHRGRARAHAQTHTHTLSLTHTHTLSPPPLPKGVSEEKAWGPRSLFPSPLLTARSSSRCIPLNRITMLLKRVILLIVTPEFFYNLSFLPSPLPHASFGPFELTASPPAPRGPGPQSAAPPGTLGQLPGARGIRVRRWRHLGHHAAVPGLLSPNLEVPDEVGTITPPPPIKFAPNHPL